MRVHSWHLPWSDGCYMFVYSFSLPGILAISCLMMKGTRRKLFIWMKEKLSRNMKPTVRLNKKLEVQPGERRIQFSSVQSLSHVRLFATPWITACQASLSITISQSSFKLMSIKSVMPSCHLILCRPLLLLPPIPPSIRGFSNESTLCMRWPKYWSFSFNISPSNEYPGLISFRMNWLDLLAFQGLSRVFSNTTVQKHQFFGLQPSLWSSSHICTWLLEKP